MADEKTEDIKQVCRIEIVFPVDSDDQAIAIKRDISEALKALPNKRFTFSIAEN